MENFQNLQKFSPQSKQYFTDFSEGKGAGTRFLDSTNKSHIYIHMHKTSPTNPPKSLPPSSLKPALPSNKSSAFITPKKKTKVIILKKGKKRRKSRDI